MTEIISAHQKSPIQYIETRVEICRKQKLQNNIKQLSFLIECKRKRKNETDSNMCLKRKKGKLFHDFKTALRCFLCLIRHKYRGSMAEATNWYNYGGVHRYNAKLHYNLLYLIKNCSLIYYS